MSLSRRDLLVSGTALIGGRRLFTWPSRSPLTQDGSPLQLSSDYPIVETTSGRVRGFFYHGVHAFKGIPYGDSTAGDARFHAPRPPRPWTDVRDALRYGPVSPQFARSYADRYAFLQGLDLGYMSEDCLRLNVWTASINDNSRRPVMFWLHEGGFHSGSGQEHAWYDGANLARRDVVVVSINHRTNAFGFLNLTAFGDQFRDSANAGLLDVVAALRWVRDHIGRFGGDPNNVTVFGQSGGGARVNCLMTMPAARGFFHKAIVQSPVPTLTEWQLPPQTERLATAVVAALGLTPERIDDIRTLPFETIAQAVLKAQQASNVGLGPTIDGRVLPEAPFIPLAPEISADIPLMIGSTLRESGPIMRPELAVITDAALEKLASDRVGGRARELVSAVRAAYPAADLIDIAGQIQFPQVREAVVTQAERKAAQGAAPAFVYLFAWRTKVLDGSPRAFHGSEVPFVFDNADESAYFTGGTAEARDLAHRISEAWVRFARTGNPNHSELPSWPRVNAGTIPTMVFDARSELRVNHDLDFRRLMRLVQQ
jgi:para-nitrobenzyl esterase